MQHYTGKAKLLLRHYRETLEDQIRDVLKSSPKELEEGGWETYREQLNETHYDEYIIVEDRLYEIQDLHVHDVDDSSYSAHQVGIDYNFEVRFHDGGESLDEAISEAIEKANR